jgi:hypothetical protein
MKSETPKTNSSFEPLNLDDLPEAEGQFSDSRFKKSPSPKLEKLRPGESDPRD